MKSIRTALTLWLMLPLALVAALVAIETFFHARKVSSDLNDRTLLAASLTILEHVIASNGSLLAEATLDSLTESLGEQFFYHVRGPNGAFVTGYSGFPRPTVETPTLLNPVFYDGEHLGEAVRAVQILRDLTDRELNGITTITTWQRLSQRGELTFHLFARSALRLVLLSLIAGIIVWFAVKEGMRPLAGLQTSIDKRSAFALSPIRQKVPVELSGIVQSMNTLLGRVARSKKNRERFIGDAAHQLRNPIAAIKIQAQSSLESESHEELRAGLQQILAVSDKSALMVNNMLASAKAHAMDAQQFTQFDLNELVNEKAVEMAPLAFDSAQEFSVSSLEKCINVVGDRTLLGEAIGNLVHNAILHNQAGANVSLSTQISSTKNTVDVIVTDDGEEISEDHFQQLTQPFRTDGTDHPGSGLGLSIAKDVARMHQGELFTTPTESGKAIVLRLPFETG